MSWRRLVQVGLFLTPLAYAGNLLATTVHEVLGHGLAGMMVGGEFHGFSIGLDGMGWARVSRPLWGSLPEELAILGGGIAATTAVGLVLFVMAWRVRAGRPMMGLTLAVVSLCLLLEGLLYLLWNAWHPVPPGDVGRIIGLVGEQRSVLGAEALRWLLMLVGGGGMLGVYYLGLSLVFGIVGRLVAGSGGPLGGWEKFVVLGLFLALPMAVLPFLFDWNRLAPGIGMVPNIAGAVVTLGAATAVWCRGGGRGWEPVEGPRIWLAVAVSWSAGVVVVAVVALVLSDGLYWGG